MVDPNAIATATMKHAPITANGKDKEMRLSIIHLPLDWSSANAGCAGSLRRRSLPLSGHRLGCCDPERPGLHSGVRADLSSASWPNPEHQLRGSQGQLDAL